MYYDNDALLIIPYYEYDKIDKVYLLHLIQDLDV